MVAVKSEYVMSVLYKDSQKIDSEGNVNWANREDYLKEENERLQQENEQLKKEKKVNRTKASLLTEIEIIKEENQKLINQIEDNDLELLEDVRHFAIKCIDLEKENKKLKKELLQRDYTKKRKR